MLKVKRNYLFILIASMILTFLAVPLCYGQEEAKSVMLEKIRLNFMSIYNDKNFELIDEIFADDCILHHSSYPDPIVGKAGIAKFIKDNAIAFPDFKLTIERFYFADGLLWNFWNGEGTHEGLLGELEATGNKMKTWGLSATKVVEGKIVEEWIVFNQMAILNQLNPTDEAPPDKPADLN